MPALPYDSQGTLTNGFDSPCLHVLFFIRSGQWCGDRGGLSILADHRKCRARHFRVVLSSLKEYSWGLQSCFNLPRVPHSWHWSLVRSDFYPPMISDCICEDLLFSVLGVCGWKSKALLILSRIIFKGAREQNQSSPYFLESPYPKVCSQSTSDMRDYFGVFINGHHGRVSIDFMYIN